MRIRKRKVPFPTSSSSPLPTTDPLFPRPPVVQLHYPHRNIPSDSDTDDYYDPKPSGKSNAVGNLRPDDAAASTSKGGKRVLCQESEDRFVRDELPNCSREGSSSNVGALLGGLSLEQNDAPRQRKEVSEREIRVAMKTDGRQGRNVPERRKRERNKVNYNGDREDLGESVSTEAGYPSSRSSKKGSSLMVGSRCSRVNGRGWRCWQQTLVGYSLCEHHLGKGRIRNTNNSKTKPKPNISSINDEFLPKLPSPFDRGEESLNSWSPVPEPTDLN